MAPLSTVAKLVAVNRLLDPQAVAALDHGLDER